MNPVTRDWTQAIVGGFISGGWSSVMATTIVTTLDPKDWGVGNVGHMAILAALTFVGGGLMSVGKYMKQHPLPGMNIGQQS